MNEKILVFSAHIRPFVGCLQIIILQSMNDVLPIFPKFKFLVRVKTQVLCWFITCFVQCSIGIPQFFAHIQKTRLS